MYDKFKYLWLSIQLNKLTIDDGFGGGAGAGTATINPPATPPAAGDQGQGAGSSPGTPSTPAASGIIPGQPIIPADPSQPVIPPITISPEVAKMFQPYKEQEQLVKTAIDTIVPYFAGQSNSRETVTKLFAADSKLASGLLYEMSSSFAENEHYINHLLKNPKLVDTLATRAGYAKGQSGAQPQGQPAAPPAWQAAAPQNQAANSNLANINVIDPITGLPDPDKVALVTMLTDIRKELDGYKGESQSFKDNQIKEKLGVIYSSALSDSNKFAESSLDALVKLEGANTGIKTSLLTVINARMDENQALKDTFSSYVTNKYEGNGILADGDMKLIKGHISEITKRVLGEVAPGLMAGNKNLLDQLGAQAALRQPGQFGTNSGLQPQTATPANPPRGNTVGETLALRALANFERNRGFAG